MAHNKLYRNFIILQEDERGYSHLSDKALSGYAKIEAKGDKCKISFYAQNLKQEDNYSMVLICCKRELKQLIDIGPLAINDVGKADTSKEYYVNNIAGLGLSYEKISGAAICKVKNNENEFVMHGFMNGEDSPDNWRKFKVVKVDSKNYINKLESESKKKDISSLSITNKIVQPNEVESKVSKSYKLESELVDSKKDESNFQLKENIELGNLNDNGFTVKDKQNRVPEKCPNVLENIESVNDDPCNEKENKAGLEEAVNKLAKRLDKYDELLGMEMINENYDERKNKDDKNAHKCHKCAIHEEFEEAKEDIEEHINKLAKKLEDDDGVLDIKLDYHVHEDVIVYGFIKDKKKHDCKWKKFKLEKKCRDEGIGSEYFQVSSRRIDENFNLDRLNQFNKEDRSDIIDFDKYENEIKPIKYSGKEAINQANTTTPMVNETPTPKITPSEASTTTPTVGETSTTTPMVSEINTLTPTVSEAVTPTTLTPEKPVACNIGKLNVSCEEKKPKYTFNLIGSIGKYFEKLAEGFQIHNSGLNDINHCKWYKVGVNSIDDLSDESNYNKYTLAFYPMLNYYPYISKVGHFLLGYKCNPSGEMKYIIYAIPGSKEKNDQPYGGRTGFVTWTSDNSNGMGYWLMFYDFKNSSIVIPTK